MYYIVVIKMHMPEETYFRSSVGKIVYLLEQWRKEQEAKAAAYGVKPPKTDSGTVKCARKFSEAIGGAKNGNK